MINGIKAEVCFVVVERGMKRVLMVVVVNSCWISMLNMYESLVHRDSQTYARNGVLMVFTCYGTCGHCAKTIHKHQWGFCLHFIQHHLTHGWCITTLSFHFLDGATLVFVV